MRKLLIFIGAVNFLAAAIVTLARNEKPSKDFWTRHAYTLFGFTVLGLIAPPVQTRIAHAGERRQRERLEREKSVREMLTSTLISIVETTGADWTRTGVSVFHVKTRVAWKRPWRWPPVNRYQTCFVRLKMSFTPPPSLIDWTEGKGLIGRCWTTRNNVTTDLRTAFGPYAAFDKAQWDALTHEQRFGLDFDEYQRTKDWYGVVGAAPILDTKGKYIGCVSFDTPQDCPEVVDANEAVQHARAMAVWIEQAKVLRTS